MIPTFGIASAGGVIVRDTRRYGIQRRQVFLMSVFLSMVHAIVEDTLVVVVVGASLLWVVGFRIAWAVVATAAVAAELSIVLDLRKGSKDRRRSRWKT